MYNRLVSDFEVREEWEIEISRNLVKTGETLRKIRDNLPTKFLDPQEREEAKKAKDLLEGEIIPPILGSGKHITLRRGSTYMVITIQKATGDPAANTKAINSLQNTKDQLGASELQELLTSIEKDRVKRLRVTVDHTPPLRPGSWIDLADMDFMKHLEIYDFHPDYVVKTEENPLRDSSGNLLVKPEQVFKRYEVGKEELLNLIKRIQSARSSSQKF